MTRLARERDADLALRHLDGDPDAFSTIVDLYQDRLFRFLYRAVGNQRRAEALAEEVFVRVFRYLDRFDSTTKFSTWIHAIASYVVENELLGQRRKANGNGRLMAAVAEKVKRLLRRGRMQRAGERRSAARRGAIERRRQS